ncbi:MAG: hypothetical protein K2X86_02175 [Cytophagaceae bacterium]|nr:hypothetical protein [Cytophagaceae bacterium]
MRLIALLLFLSLSFVGFAQKKNKKCNEGCAPKVSLYIVKGDSLQLINYLDKEHENRIRVVVEGGIENVKHTVFVTSKNAIIRKDTATANEYLVIPQKEICEIIVDVKTFELYKSFREYEKDGKIVRELLREYPPKTYMVGYERYEVR